MEQRSPALQVLTCDVVLEKILSYLPLEDLKTLTVVARGVKEAVRKAMQFRNRVQLHITEQAIQSGLIVEGIFFPKHISLELFNCLNLERGGLVREMVEGAESLQMGSNPPVAFGEVHFTNYMNQVLTIAKKMTSLEMSAGILYEVSPKLFCEPEIQETLSRLHSFKITADRRQVFPESLHEVLRQSLNEIAAMPLKLRAFHIGKLGYNLDVSLKKEYVSFIPLLIEKSKESLEELELLDARIWRLDEMNDITCPNLKRLRIAALEVDRSFITVETFLRNQLPLEEVNIFMPAFPRQILELILDSSSKLKKLGLKAHEFVGEAPNINWQKLEGLPELKEFSLVATLEEFRTVSSLAWKERCESILRRLPRTVEKITLQGFRYFWRRGQNLRGMNIGRLLAGFSNLTQVNLNRCYGAVTNVGLQSMIRLCPKLTRLRFSHSDVTNYGVTGYNGNGKKTGASLDDLEGLTHLVIMFCPGISPEVLVDVLRFKFLRSLCYIRIDPVPKEVLVRAALRNPCLERLRMNTGIIAPVNLDALREEVIRANPRVRHLGMEEPPWSDCDTDADAWT